MKRLRCAAYGALFLYAVYMGLIGAADLMFAKGIAGNEQALNAYMCIAPGFSMPYHAKCAVLLRKYQKDKNQKTLLLAQNEAARAINREPTENNYHRRLARILEERYRVTRQENLITRALDEAEKAVMLSPLKQRNIRALQEIRETAQNGEMF